MINQSVFMTMPNKAPLYEADMSTPHTDNIALNLFSFADARKVTNSVIQSVDEGTHNISRSVVHRCIHHMPVTYL